MKIYRGLIHFHSNYSFDSILSLKNIVNFALKEDLNFLILTDHDSIEGSIALRKYVEERGINIEVIVAAEYNTEFGDIIAINIEKEITEMGFQLFVKQVRNQNGILLLPHPYYGHTNIEEVANKMDFIEVFNSRVDDASNERALTLANKFNKSVYYATDAHNYNSLKNCILEFKKDGGFIESLLSNALKKPHTKKTYRVEVLFSQFIRSFKNKDYVLFMGLVKRLLISLIKFNIHRKV
jgi:predicted metal-dependent phosphoesterase TrpH